MTVAQLAHEVAIEWTRDDARDHPYVRQSVATTRKLDGRPPRTHGDHLVGWALMHADTPRLNGMSRTVLRRYFWLRDSDRPFAPDGPFADKVPAEAVDPRTVAAGQPGRKTKRMHAPEVSR